MAARMSQVQYQSVRDIEKVRAFFVRYQDRLLYGTDLTLNPRAEECRGIQGMKRTTCGRGTGAIWPRTKASASRSSRRMCPGLALPREVIDKVYYGNAARAFALN